MSTWGYTSSSSYYNRNWYKYESSSSSDNYYDQTSELQNSLKKMKEKIVAEQTCFLFDPKGLVWPS